MVSRKLVSALAVAILLLAACGDDDDDTSGSPSAPAESEEATDEERTETEAEDDDDDRGEPGLEVTFDVTGSVPISTVATTDLPTIEVATPESCAEYVEGSNGIFALPRFFGTEDVDGMSVQMLIAIEDYSGPGTYTGDSVDTEGGVFLLIEHDAFYGPDGGPDPTVTVEDDGSGEFVFEGLHTQSTPDLTVSGTISWTCND